MDASQATKHSKKEKKTRRLDDVPEKREKKERKEKKDKKEKKSKKERRHDSVASEPDSTATEADHSTTDDAPSLSVSLGAAPDGASSPSGQARTDSSASLTPRSAAAAESHPGPFRLRSPSLSLPFLKHSSGHGSSSDLHASHRRTGSDSTSSRRDAGNDDRGLAGSGKKASSSAALSDSKREQHKEASKKDKKVKRGGESKDDLAASSLASSSKARGSEQKAEAPASSELQPAAPPKDSSGFPRDPNSPGDRPGDNDARAAHGIVSLARPALPPQLTVTTATGPTADARTLLASAAVGQSAGLRKVSFGGVPGGAGSDTEDSAPTAELSRSETDSPRASSSSFRHLLMPSDPEASVEVGESSADVILHDAHSSELDSTTDPDADADAPLSTSVVVQQDDDDEWDGKKKLKKKRSGSSRGSSKKLLSTSAPAEFSDLPRVGASGGASNLLAFVVSHLDRKQKVEEPKQAISPMTLQRAVHCKAFFEDKYKKLFAQLAAGEVYNPLLERRQQLAAASLRDGKDNKTRLEEEARRAALERQRQEEAQRGARLQAEAQQRLDDERAKRLEAELDFEARFNEKHRQDQLKIQKEEDERQKKLEQIRKQQQEEQERLAQLERKKQQAAATKAQKRRGSAPAAPANLPQFNVSLPLGARPPLAAEFAAGARPSSADSSAAVPSLPLHVHFPGQRSPPASPRVATPRSLPAFPPSPFLGGSAPPPSPALSTDSASIDPAHQRQGRVNTFFKMATRPTAGLRDASRNIFGRIENIGQRVLHRVPDLPFRSSAARRRDGLFSPPPERESKREPIVVPRRKMSLDGSTQSLDLAAVEHKLRSLAESPGATSPASADDSLLDPPRLPGQPLSSNVSAGSPRAKTAGPATISPEERALLDAMADDFKTRKRTSGGTSRKPPLPNADVLESASRPTSADETSTAGRPSDGADATPVQERVAAQAAELQEVMGKASAARRQSAAAVGELLDKSDQLAKTRRAVESRHIDLKTKLATNKDLLGLTASGLVTWSHQMQKLEELIQTSQRTKASGAYARAFYRVYSVAALVCAFLLLFVLPPAASLPFNAPSWTLYVAALLLSAAVAAVGARLIVDRKKAAALRQPARPNAAAAASLSEAKKFTPWSAAGRKPGTKQMGLARGAAAVSSPGELRRRHRLPGTDAGGFRRAESSGEFGRASMVVSDGVGGASGGGGGGGAKDASLLRATSLGAIVPGTSHPMEALPTPSLVRSPSKEAPASSSEPASAVRSVRTPDRPLASSSAKGPGRHSAASAQSAAAASKPAEPATPFAPPSPARLPSFSARRGVAADPLRARLTSSGGADEPRRTPLRVSTRELRPSSSVVEPPVSLLTPDRGRARADSRAEEFKSKSASSAALSTSAQDLTSLEPLLRLQRDNVAFVNDALSEIRKLREAEATTT